MESALLAVVALACPVGMLLMGIVMWKERSSSASSDRVKRARDTD